jgi:hypothetical protein
MHKNIRGEKKRQPRLFSEVLMTKTVSGVGTLRDFELTCVGGRFPEL